MLRETSTRIGTTASPGVRVDRVRPAASGRARSASSVTKRRRRGSARAACRERHAPVGVPRDAAAAQTTSASAHQGSGFANVTAHFFALRERLVVARDQSAGRRPGRARCRRRSTDPRRCLRASRSRHRGLVLFEREVDILAKRLPAAEILLERLGAGSRRLNSCSSGVEPPDRRAARAAHAAERLARPLQLAAVFLRAAAARVAPPDPSRRPLPAVLAASAARPAALRRVALAGALLALAARASRPAPRASCCSSRSSRSRISRVRSSCSASFRPSSGPPPFSASTTASSARASCCSAAQPTPASRRPWLGAPPCGRRAPTRDRGARGRVAHPAPTCCPCSCWPASRNAPLRPRAHRARPRAPPAADGRPGRRAGPSPPRDAERVARRAVACRAPSPGARPPRRRAAAPRRSAALRAAGPRRRAAARPRSILRICRSSRLSASAACSALAAAALAFCRCISVAALRICSAARCMSLPDGDELPRAAPCRRGRGLHLLLQLLGAAARSSSCSRVRRFELPLQLLGRRFAWRAPAAAASSSSCRRARSRIRSSAIALVLLRPCRLDC